jgi:GAF domain-containing protein
MGGREEGLERQFEDLLKFEALFDELSAGFISLPADRIDTGIEDAQRRICECLNIDHSCLFQAPPNEPYTLHLTHVFQPPDFHTVAQQDADVRLDPDWVRGQPGVAPVIVGMDASGFFPRLLERSLHGETTVIQRLEDLPPEVGGDREMIRRFGVKSNVTVPLSTAGKVFGVITFGMLRKERQWDAPLVKRLGLVARVFANALLRKRSEEALRESETRLRDITFSMADWCGRWTRMASHP